VAARKFIPSQHPRDRFGRFTRSRSARATPAELKTAQDTAAALNPKRGITGAKAGPYLQGIAPERGQAAVSAYTGGGYVDTHKALRAGKTDSPDVRAMDDAMVELPDDLVLSRRVPIAAFGNVDPESLEGLTVRDAAYAPTSIGTVRPAKDTVRMRIAAPAGTRAAVDPGTGEVILDRDLDMVVARVARTPSGVDMYVTVLPRRRGGDSSDNDVTDGSSPGNDSGTDDNGPADGADEVRADLMRRKLPELRAEAKDRGIKGYSRLRKSQLVDLLVADETGDEQTTRDREDSADLAPAAVADQAPSDPGDEPATAPLTGAAAVAAAPVGAGSAEPQKLTRQQKTTLTLLKEPYGRPSVQRALAGGEASAATETHIAALDEMMAGSPLPNSVEVWQGSSRPRDVFGDSLAGDLAGFEWDENRFVFTSATEKAATQSTKAADRSGGVLMRITAPEGAAAVSLSKRDLILDRGHRMRVTADRGVNADGNRVLDVEMLPRTGPPPTRENAPAAEDLADPARAVAYRPSGADNSISRGYASGIVSSEDIAAGDMAQTSFVEFGDGSRAVKKVARQIEDKTVRRQQDAEELAPLVLGAAGLRAPEIHRPKANELYMQVMPGRLAMGLPRDKLAPLAASRERYDEDQWMLLGMVDQAIDNFDRHEANWIVDDAGNISGIDHGFAFGYAEGVTAREPRVVLGQPSQVFGQGAAAGNRWVPNDIHPDDAAAFRARVEALLPEFERLGRRDWYEKMLIRIDLIGEHASGLFRRMT